MYTLVYDMLGKVVQKVQDMLNHRLIGQSTQPDAVLGGARRDEVLWGMGKCGAQVSVTGTGGHRVEGVASVGSSGTHLRQQRQLHGGRKLSNQWGLTVIARLV